MNAMTDKLGSSKSLGSQSSNREEHLEMMVIKQLQLKSNYQDKSEDLVFSFADPLPSCLLGDEQVLQTLSDI